MSDDHFIEALTMDDNRDHSDYRWGRFCDLLATILRVDGLRGATVLEDGYSLVEAYQFFEEGKLASEYAGVVRARLLAWGRS